MDYSNLLNNLDKYLNKDQKIKTDNKDICINCSTSNFIHDYTNSIVVCSDCGLVIGEILENNDEGVNYDDKPDTTRVGGIINPLLPKSSMTTYINGHFGSINKIHKWNQMPSDERSLWIVYKYIESICKENNYSQNISDNSCLIYKKITEKQDNFKVLTRGIKRISLITVCIYISLKEDGKILRRDEISKLTGITIKDFNNGLKLFNEIQNKKSIVINSYNKDIIHDYIIKYSKILEIDDKYKRLIHNLSVRCRMIYILQNNNKNTICSGLFYYISKKYNLNIGKNKIITTFNISEVSINKIYKELEEYSKILFIGLEDY